MSETGDKSKQIRLWGDNRSKLSELQKKYPYVSFVRVANLALRLGIPELESVLGKLPKEMGKSLK